jgi:hypothetical protein
MHTRDVFTKYPHFDRHTQESTKRKYPHIEVNGICTQDMYSQNIHTLIGTHKITPNTNIHTLRLMVYAHKKCIHKISTRDGFTKYPHFDRHTQESTKHKYPHIEVNGLCTQEIYSQNIHTLLGTHKSPPNPNIHTSRSMVYAHSRWIHKISTL